MSSVTEICTVCSDLSKFHWHRGVNNKKRKKKRNPLDLFTVAFLTLPRVLMESAKPGAQSDKCAWFLGFKLGSQRSAATVICCLKIHELWFSVEVSCPLLMRFPTSVLSMPWNIMQWSNADILHHLSSSSEAVSYDLYVQRAYGKFFANTRRPLLEAACEPPFTEDHAFQTRYHVVWKQIHDNCIASYRVKRDSMKLYMYARSHLRRKKKKPEKTQKLLMNDWDYSVCYCWIKFCFPLCHCFLQRDLAGSAIVWVKVKYLFSFEEELNIFITHLMLLKVLFLGCKKALFLHSKWDISPLKEAKTSLSRDQKTVPDFFCCCLFVFKERNNKQTKQKECWKRQCKIKMYLNDLLIIGTLRGIHLFIYSSFANIGEKAETRLFQPSLSFAASFICLPVLKSNTYLSLFYGNLQGFCCVSLLELASSSHGCREDQYERLISLEDWIILFRKKIWRQWILHARNITHSDKDGV